jgi:hypothetical protein
VHDTILVVHFAVRDERARVQDDRVPAAVEIDAEVQDR